MLTLDSAMALRELGWKPRLGLNEAIDWTADWYFSQVRGEDAATLCLAQIRRYFASDSVKVAA